MRKNKIRILHVAQAAGGVDRYISTPRHTQQVS